MAGSIVTPHRREKPLMVFDGECSFCRRWITRWQQATGDAVDYAPSQEVAATFPEIPPPEFDREVKLIEPNGRVYGGAEAVFRVLCRGDRPGVWARLAWGFYRDVPGFARAAETGYHLVAAHRPLASAATSMPRVGSSNRNTRAAPISHFASTTFC